VFASIEDMIKMTYAVKQLKGLTFHIYTQKASLFLPITFYTICLDWTPSAIIWSLM